jgi:phosphatidate cytidylyltransferase
MFRIRLVSGLLMGALVFGLFWLDESLTAQEPTSFSPGFLALVMLAMTAASAEYFRMARLAGARPFPVLGMVLVNAFIAAGWWIGWATYRGSGVTAVQAALLAGGAFAALGSIFIAQAVRGNAQSATINIGTTVLGVAYLGAAAMFIFFFRFAVGSMWTFAAALFIVKMTDSGAYGAGRFFGRRPLTWISPKKTWEGLFGGLAAAAVLGLVFGLLAEPYPWLWLPLGKSLIIAPVIGFAGQLGDLAKSILKRDVGVKDSGSVIPGMGGVLDVVDSPLAAAPVAYILWIALQAW